MNWSQLGVDVFQALLPAGIALVGYVGHWLGRWLRAHAQGQAAATGLDVLENFAGTVVMNLEQTVVAETKARSAKGSLTPADAKEIKQKALEALKGYYGPEGLAALGKSLKMNESAISRLIADKIEVAVYRLKNPNQAGLPVFRSGPPTP